MKKMLKIWQISFYKSILTTKFYIFFVKIVIKTYVKFGVFLRWNCSFRPIWSPNVGNQKELVKMYIYIQNLKFYISLLCTA